MGGRRLRTGRPNTRPQDTDFNGDFSEFEEVVELIESLEAAPDPQVRAAHIRSAAEASGLFLLRRLGVAGVPLTRILGRVAAVLLVLAVSVSALGAAAALPEPLQNAVATVAGYFGIDMPQGAEEVSEPGLLPSVDQESPAVDQPLTTSVIVNNDRDNGGGSSACEYDIDFLHESDEDEPTDDECVDVDDDQSDGDKEDEAKQGDDDREDEAKQGDDDREDEAKQGDDDKEDKAQEEGDDE